MFEMKQMGEKEKKGKSVDKSAGTDVPSRFSDKESKHAAAKPYQNKNLTSYSPVKVKKTPGKKE